MKRDVGLIGGIVALLFLVGAAHAAIWYVHPDSALNSIQAGLDSCANNDTVRVGPGTYVENIVWPNTQGIHLISELGPEMTIIDGNSTNSVIRITTGVDSTTIINGFTIQNGGGITISGGGISCYNNTSPTITGNTITNNYAIIYGGGIFCGSGCSPIISDNAITNNAAGGHFGGGGGGIFCDSNSLAIILDNMITNNSAESFWDGSGGGIYCWNYNGMINGNTITGNYAFYCGGGIYCYWGSPEIRNNTIADNTANWGGGIFCYDNSSPTIDSCTITNNTGDGIYCQGGSYPEIHYNDIFSNTPYGVRNVNASVTVNAENNWWGDSTGPYHPDSNPGGLGDTVSDYVDFIPWLYWPGVEEKPIIKPVEKHETFGATLFSGPLLLPEGKKCKLFDITGRVVEPTNITRGIYFIEVDGVVTQKVVKVR